MMKQIDWDKAPAGIKGLADSPRGYVWFTEFHYWYADNSVTKWIQFGAPGHLRFTDLTNFQYAGLPETTVITTASDFLSAGMKILTERGQQYGSDDRECSFPQAAAAFNAITGHNLKGSDICLIVALIKQVRQYAQPGRFHEDSAIDCVNYTALQSQELKRERGGK